MTTGKEEEEEEVFMMMMTFITQGGEGRGNTNKKSNATKSKGRGLEEGAVVISIVRLVLRNFFLGSFLERLVDVGRVTQLVHLGRVGRVAPPLMRDRHQRPSREALRCDAGTPESEHLRAACPCLL